MMTKTKSRKSSFVMSSYYSESFLLFCLRSQCDGFGKEEANSTRKDKQNVMSQGSLKGKHNLPVSICQGMEKIEGKRECNSTPHHQYFLTYLGCWNNG